MAVGETVEMQPDPVLPDPAEPPGAGRGTSPPAIHQAHRRPMGIHPVPLLGGLGSALLLAAIALFAAGSVVVGLILLGLAVALLTLFAGGVRRQRDAPGAQFTLTAADRLSASARVLAVTLRAWTQAGLDLVRIRGRRHRLRHDLRASLAPLGEAVHHDDATRAQVLKQQAADLERKLGDTNREASAAISAARQKIDDERATIAPTEALPTVQAEARTDGRAHGPRDQREARRP